MKSDTGRQLKKAALRYSKKHKRRKMVMERERMMNDSNVFSKFEHMEKHREA